MNAEALDLWNRAKKALGAAETIVHETPILLRLVHIMRHFMRCLHILPLMGKPLQSIVHWNLQFIKTW